MQKIVLVDDEEGILAPIKVALEESGYEVRTFTKGTDALQYFEHNPVDLAVLDVKMPDMTGHTLLQKLRVKNPSLPVVFLSSKDEEQDQLIGFTLGADDYITKPFTNHLLIARIAAVLRRHNMHEKADPNTIVRAGDLQIDKERHLVEWKGDKVHLTVTECLLLLSMASRPGIVKGRSELMRAAYDEAIYVSNRTIDSHIRNIRNKLLEVDVKCNIITTIHGLGYKLEA